MKSSFTRLTAFRAILIVSLFLTTLFAMGSGISCSSPPPAPPPASPGLPEESTPGASATPSTIEVIIEGFAFKPAEITVPAGSVVTWRNRDGVTHTVTARDKSFDSGSLSGGETFSYTFKEKGTFEYYCTPHSYMSGKVIVE